MIGKSLQTGWSRRPAASVAQSAVSRSSEIMTAPAPCMSASQIPVMWSKKAQAMPAPPSSLSMAWASRRVGGRTRIRVAAPPAASDASPGIFPLVHQARVFAEVRRDAGENSLELGQRLSNAEAAFVQFQFADGFLMLSIALLDD